MSRYADIEPLENALKAVEKRGEVAVLLDELLGVIAKYPTADVQEVRHGRWVPITEDGIVPAEFSCSVCGRKISHSGVKDMVSINYPYCHCGAKMDEVEKCL